MVLSGDEELVSRRNGDVKNAECRGKMPGRGANSPDSSPGKVTGQPVTPPEGP